MAHSYSRGTPRILSAVNSMSATFASSVRVVEFRWMAFNGWHSPFARTIYAISVWAEFFSLVTMPPFDNDFFIPHALNFSSLMVGFPLQPLVD